MERRLEAQTTILTSSTHGKYPRYWISEKAHAVARKSFVHYPINVQFKQTYPISRLARYYANLYLGTSSEDLCFRHKIIRVGEFTQFMPCLMNQNLRITTVNDYHQQEILIPTHILPHLPSQTYMLSFANIFLLSWMKTRYLHPIHLQQWTSPRRRSFTQTSSSALFSLILIIPKSCRGTNAEVMRHIRTCHENFLSNLLSLGSGTEGHLTLLHIVIHIGT